jgi:hypothetical protein
MISVAAISNLLPSREKVDRATLRETDEGAACSAVKSDVWSGYHPLIRQPSAATFSREGRRLVSVVL